MYHFGPNARSAGRSAVAEVRRSQRGFVRALLLVVSLAAAPTFAHAVSSKTYCLGDSVNLEDTLATADEGQSVSLDIRVRQGTYFINPVSHSFSAPVTISGGYSDPDRQVRNANPYNTVIDLSGGSLTLIQPKALSRAR